MLCVLSLSIVRIGQRLTLYTYDTSDGTEFLMISPKKFFDYAQYFLCDYNTFVPESGSAGLTGCISDELKQGTPACYDRRQEARVIR